MALVIEWMVSDIVVESGNIEIHVAMTVACRFEEIGNSGSLDIFELSHCAYLFKNKVRQHYNYADTHSVHMVMLWRYSRENLTCACPALSLRAVGHKSAAALRGDD